MSFAPVVPFNGYTGWAFLARTRAAQEAAFAGSAEMNRDESYFRERIGSVETAEELVADRRLLSVALGAFGLSGDIGNKYFIRKVFEDGTLRPDALANKLADKRYLELSRAFGFGDYAVPRTQLSDFADRILAEYKTNRFEEAVGAQSNELRLALTAERELAELAMRDLSGDAKWLTALGSAPLREVLQTAFGLPDSFAQIDLDRQVAVLKGRADRYLGGGDLAQFQDPGKVEDLVRLYLLRSQIQGFGAGYSPQSVALSVLKSAHHTGGLLSRLV
ncbi:hypothetical protein DEA8626_02513 [Defluviimonas aquaemixtae]|uniref:Flagellar protein n=1 Tax=Albidovulum aquaemixtae TaxID=1542388 RepID=A0A2R8BJ63_9RHOB|nr:DUF1217 domain-containing protein [Defluviimonas aquaemixtae]SPH23450.1 hypothetical protein DEA8626_02513 [Defluviimonas aquaemixtae]